MNSFEFYLEEQKKTIKKLVVKNNSNLKRLFMILDGEKIIRLLVVKGNDIEKVEIPGEMINVSVKEVTD